MSEHFDQLIEQAYRQYRGPAYMRSPAVSCIKMGIRLMDFVVPGPTAAYLGKRFFTPRRVPTRESDKQTMGMASSITYITLSNDKQAVVYHWGQQGPKVLLAHGWESRASHFSRLIQILVERGFQVIGFDAPAHGDAEGNQSSIVEFIEIIQRLEQQEGGFDAMVAHSFGGLSAINAVKAGLRTKALVIVGAPTHFSGLVTKYASILNLPARQQQRLRGYIERYFGIGDAVWQRFSAYEGLRQIEQPALIIHDSADDIVLEVEAECLAQAWPAACLVKTQGLGHNPLRRPGEGIDLVLAHLAPLQP
ncbi:pimeloyl-ACP methyl ester carboxylesterase [Serratia sp. PL17]|uniref:alpha/beta fold hydrolase n=1 Tax=Serratia sp. PL17 TaxID=2806582 RepID=UPI001AE9CB9E|nr:alpha/beta hydrolase [Serratia sp. PL17]MBP1132047.1 pimeloyl-ACP methyl ester carboxylesterase [Serratia sp. PL17]